ncbi:hypothetical protein ACU686_17370 [Yinghuangia aomiensis]
MNERAKSLQANDDRRDVAGRLRHARTGVVRLRPRAVRPRRHEERGLPAVTRRPRTRSSRARTTPRSGYRTPTRCSAAIPG